VPSAEFVAIPLTSLESLRLFTSPTCIGGFYLLFAALGSGTLTHSIHFSQLKTLLKGILFCRFAVGGCSAHFSGFGDIIDIGRLAIHFRLFLILGPSNIRIFGLGVAYFVTLPSNSPTFRY
jgi:hypothetical protein